MAALRIAADPFSKNTHRIAADRIELGLAPGSGFSKAKVMQNLDDELDAPDWANEDDAHRLPTGLLGWIVEEGKAISCSARTLVAYGLDNLLTTEAVGWTQSPPQREKLTYKNNKVL